MHIVSTEGASSLVSGTDQYDADENGLFDVPWELGQRLLAFPGWREATEEESLAANGATAPEPEEAPDGDDPADDAGDDDEADEGPSEADETAPRPKRRRRPRPE